MKKIITIVLTVYCYFASAQNINDYKYALVPSKFSIFKKNDYYRLNVTTKLYMEKYGFETYLDTDEQPAEFKNDNCNKVYVDLIQSNTMFVTRIQVVLKDCYGKIIATSNEGKSKEKDYQIAYNQALREALDSFTILINHKYNGKQPANSKPVETKIEREEPKPTIVVNNSTNGISELFAKPFQNGFQLLTNTTAIPNLVLTISKTTNADCFIAEQNENKGVLLKKIDGWYFEYYKEGKLVSEKYTIVNF